MSVCFLTVIPSGSWQNYFILWDKIKSVSVFFGLEKVFKNAVDVFIQRKILIIF